jgi:hypothetical protein
MECAGTQTNGQDEPTTNMKEESKEAEALKCGGGLPFNCTMKRKRNVGYA